MTSCRGGDRRHPVSAGPIFHYDRSLARLGGDPALFAEVAELFLTDSTTLLEQARGGLQAADCRLLARSAHSLKSLSATFDADDLTLAAATVEQHARDGDCASAAVCFGDLERELARLRAALADYSKPSDGAQSAKGAET